MIVAEYLQPDAVVVPITCNDAVDRGPLKQFVQPKTRIGSPYVLAGMDKARQRGCRRICGWEANGGFLTGSDFTRIGRVLRALPTRDAMLPILAVLFSVVERKRTLPELFDQLPQRFSTAGLLRQFPRSVGRKIIQALSPGDLRIQEITFAPDPELLDENGARLQSDPERERALAIRSQLESLFAKFGSGPIRRRNFLDGVRIYFTNSDIAHLRPSGNADEMRIYAAANEPERALATPCRSAARAGSHLRTRAGRTSRS